MKTILRLLRLPALLLVLLGWFGLQVGRGDLRASAEGSARRELQALSRRQTNYHDEHGRYASDLASLDFVGLTTIDMRVAGEAWAATAEYVREDWLMGFRVHCAIAVGPPSIPSWGRIDMRGMPSGEVRCETE